MLVSRQEALSKNLPFYFTGKVCRRGHIDKRYLSSGDCVCCAAEKNRRYQKVNKEKKSLWQEKYRKNNLSKIAAKEAKRRAKKFNATPNWLTPEHLAEIETIYEYARNLGYHVDHIIPLNNPKVCGMHVPWNLEAIPSIENIKKSNNFEENYFGGIWN